MRVVPRNTMPQIQFFQTHVGKWAEHPEQIGTSAEEVAALAALVAEANAALRAQQAAKIAARAATHRLKTARAEMNRLGSAILMKVRGTARAGSEVYALAWIPAPAKPSPIGPLGKPYDLRVELEQIGWLTLRWKCKNPAAATGRLYRVSRRLGPNAPFTILGVSGKRKFVDPTVPAGSSFVEYQVQATRGSDHGPAARYQLNLGTTGDMPDAMIPREKSGHGAPTTVSPAAA